MVVKEKETECKNCCDCSGNNWKHGGGAGSSGAVFGMGVVGAIFYYFQHAATAGDYAMGVLKALVWPAMLVYKALEMLKF